MNRTRIALAASLFLPTLLLLSPVLTTAAPSVGKKAATKASGGGFTKIDDKEARAAFDYLNRVRQNPAAFSKEIGVDLSKVQKRPALVWNDILGKVSRDKALDMANRDYFGHVTPDGFGINYLMNAAGYKLLPAWLQDKKANYFESIAAGYPTGVETIRQLILDKGVPDLGHRKHLLGMTPFWANCNDSGIGFVEASGRKFPTFVSIVIAKHDDGGGIQPLPRGKRMMTAKTRK